MNRAFDNCERHHLPHTSICLPSCPHRHPRTPATAPSPSPTASRCRPSASAARATCASRRCSRRWRRATGCSTGAGDGVVPRAAEAPHVNRSELFLTSNSTRDLGEQPTLDAFPRSLAPCARYLDAFLLHYPACFGSPCATPPAGTWRESWRALEALYDQGRIRALGVSNFAPSQLRELLGGRASGRTLQSWMDPPTRSARSAALCRPRRPVPAHRRWHPARRPHRRRQPGAQAPGGRRARRGGARAGAGGAAVGAAARPPSSALDPPHIAANRALHDFSLTEAQLRAVDALDGQDPAPCSAGCRRSRAPTRTLAAPRAEAGECEANAAFMLVSCRGSCNVRGEGGAVETADFDRKFRPQFLPRLPTTKLAADFSQLVEEGGEERQHQRRQPEAGSSSP